MEMTGRYLCMCGVSSPAIDSRGGRCCRSSRRGHTATVASCTTSATFCCTLLLNSRSEPRNVARDAYVGALPRMLQCRRRAAV